MELIEKPNMRAIHYLNRTTFSQFKNDCLSEAKVCGDKRPKESDIHVWYNTLKQFCATHIKTKGITTRIYAYSQNTPAGLGGRLYGGGSIQGVWKPYRGLLMRGITTDIDMVNAHPVILRYVCLLHNEPCPNLEYYINHRDDCLALFSNRDVGKKAFLKATNKEKPIRDKTAPMVLKEYDREMKTIQ